MSKTIELSQTITIQMTVEMDDDLNTVIDSKVEIVDHDTKSLYETGKAFGIGNNFPCAVCGEFTVPRWEVEEGFDTCTQCVPR